MTAKKIEKQGVVVQLLSHVRLFETPSTTVQFPGKLEPSSLLMGMQNGTAVVENGMMTPQKITQSITT